MSEKTFNLVKCAHLKIVLIFIFTWRLSSADLMIPITHHKKVNAHLLFLQPFTSHDITFTVSKHLPNVH